MLSEKQIIPTSPQVKCQYDEENVQDLLEQMEENLKKDKGKLDKDLRLYYVIPAPFRIKKQENILEVINRYKKQGWSIKISKIGEQTQEVLSYIFQRETEGELQATPKEGEPKEKSVDEVYLEQCQKEVLIQGIKERLRGNGVVTEFVLVLNGEAFRFFKKSVVNETLDLFRDNWHIKEHYGATGPEYIFEMKEEVKDYRLKQ